MGHMIGYFEFHRRQQVSSVNTFGTNGILLAPILVDSGDGASVTLLPLTPPSWHLRLYSGQLELVTYC